MANQSHGIGCTFQLGFGGSSAGVFILKVQEGGPAAAAGVQSGDRLLGFFLDSKVSLHSCGILLFLFVSFVEPDLTRFPCSSFPCPMSPLPCQSPSVPLALKLNCYFTQIVVRRLC